MTQNLASKAPPVKVIASKESHKAISQTNPPHSEQSLIKPGPEYIDAMSQISIHDDQISSSSNPDYNPRPFSQIARTLRVVEAVSSKVDQLMAQTKEADQKQKEEKAEMDEKLRKHQSLTLKRYKYLKEEVAVVSGMIHCLHSAIKPSADDEGGLSMYEQLSDIMDEIASLDERMTNLEEKVEAWRIGENHDRKIIKEKVGKIWEMVALLGDELIENESYVFTMKKTIVEVEETVGEILKLLRQDRKDEE